VEYDPEALLLLNYEQENKLRCFILDSKDFDGRKSRLDALKVVKQNTLVVKIPQTLDYIQAIVGTKGSGVIFHATGGKHLNSDDYFKSRALIRRRIRIKELETKKKRLKRE